MFLFWLRTCQLGVKSLLLHPMRSILTMLGIFIGVASVIYLLAFGEGISRKAAEQIESLGATNIIVRSIKPAELNLQNSSGGGRPSIIPYGITRADYDRLKSTISTITDAIPVRELRRTFLRNGVRIDGRLVGCTAKYQDINRLVLNRGRFIEDIDGRNRMNFCVLSQNVAEKLFGFEEPVGRTVNIQSAANMPVPYTVIGVLEHKDPSAGIGGSLTSQDFTNDIYIPIETFWGRFGDEVINMTGGSVEAEKVELSQITLQVDHRDNVLETAELIRMTIEKHHSRMKDFGITVPLELLRQAENTRVMFMVFMGLIAGISLLVGGIGIMNIMLATVTERTREIGIRRALGAKRGDIVRQFLVETIVLSVVGGALGIIAGLLCLPITKQVWWAISTYFPEMYAALPDTVRGIEPIIVGWSIPLSFGVSVTIGIVFGLYPAARAAAMDPIEALRHE
ncbi:MAG: ABC transporter permease [Planctomycetaceae bacterium]|nr:ABC transporter permease [Planctomycetaceae bacterium]